MAKIKSIDEAKALISKSKKQNTNNDWLFSRQYNNQAPKPIAPDPLITIQDNIILTPGNYITISGKPKAGKTGFISGLIAAGLSGQYSLGWQVFTQKNIVLLDTEQGEYEFYNVVEQIKKLSGIDSLPKNFLAYRMRGISADKIRDAIEIICNDTNTELLIIDGLLDTIIDFNDIRECRLITDLLRDITEQKKIGIVCIIHQSKSNNYTIGHLGSFADRYSQSVIEVIKEDDVSSLKPVYLRSGKNFEPLNIYYDTNQNQWAPHATTPQNALFKDAELSAGIVDQIISQLFAGKNDVTYTEAENLISKNLHIPKKKVSGILKQMLSEKLIEKTANGTYRMANIPF